MKESDVPLDFEEESRRLWSEYHAARDADFAGYDFEAVSSKLRSLRRKASNRGLTVIVQQLGDLANYVSLAKKKQQTPEQRLRSYWPALIPSVIEAALHQAEEALKENSVPKLRRAMTALRCTEQPEYLAEIAEEGLAEEFAPHIPGAVEDEGMLVLSAEHEALIERGRVMLGRLHAAVGGRRA
ncbi:hypothetical protein [Polyangium jinanense]|uniref:Uncharacterized protein n=1 Tax=Polyangium jinanense TaxID=2829994 RepID=A0A9X4AR71_9BACT|nr:hypothetical protein [Polyangium jinanense]MDC3953080.1 hypothetical protein [Polyangium jinanense]MDC3979807.1 hypothetical protein [Polyangium jinanense]